MGKIEELRKQAMMLPMLPGVYIMKNSDGNVIYVGKAKALRNRVSQYFTRVESHTVKVYKMVMNVDHFDFIIASSETEALVLECSLIKQYMPKYNILLKDDKGYFYVKIDNSPYGKITAEKQRSNEGEYLGPYMSFFTVRQSVEFANLAFMLPTCKRKFPEDFGKERPCLNYHIGRCMGVCKGNISKEKYQEALHGAVDFIKKGEKETVNALEKKMNGYSENLMFEKAAELRDRIRAIEKIKAKQNVRTERSRDKDFFAFVKYEKGIMLSILSFKKGVLRDKVDYDNRNTADEIEETASQAIVNYYDGREIPQYIVVNIQLTDKEALEEYLSRKSDKKIKIITAPAGENKKLIGMAEENATEKIAFISKESSTVLATLNELAGALGLSALPRYIESADISHTAGDSTVGVIVVFKNGVPYKKAYKKFNISEENIGNDPGALAEVYERRFYHFKNEKETDEGFKTLPDLILLDGGKVQVSAVKSVLEKMEINVPVFGIVKDDKHRTRGITDGCGEIEVKRTSLLYKLSADIGEEVHRFAITSHRKKRTKTLLEQKLTTLDGVGEKTAEKIWKKYKTKEAIIKTGAERISAEIKIPLETAKKITDILGDI